MNVILTEIFKHECGSDCFPFFGKVKFLRVFVADISTPPNLRNRSLFFFKKNKFLPFFFSTKIFFDVISSPLREFVRQTRIYEKNITFDRSISFKKGKNINFYSNVLWSQITVMNVRIICTNMQKNNICLQILINIIEVSR